LAAAQVLRWLADLLESKNFFTPEAAVTYGAVLAHKERLIIFMWALLNNHQL